VGSLVANCIDTTIRLSDDNLPEEELSPYLKLEQEIIFKVNSFDATHSFIDGIIDRQCFEKMKQFIQLNEFEGYFYFNQTFIQISLISSLFFKQNPLEINHFYKIRFKSNDKFSNFNLFLSYLKRRYSKTFPFYHSFTNRL
jgi:hypothetical protein